MYMQIAGACSRMQRRCLERRCWFAWQSAMRISVRQNAVGRQRKPRPAKAARVSMDKAAHIAYRADLMRQIR